MYSSLERPVNWCRQTEDKIINEKVVGKDREIYEPVINPYSPIIKSVGIGSTVIYVENARNEFHQAFERYAKERNLYGYTEDGGTPEDKEKEEVILLNIEDLIFNFDPEDNVQKEELFKLKLKFFDRDEVKSSKKRKAKTDLRKAETPLEAIVLYNSFVK